MVEIVGQDRAVKAIKRGLAMKSHGYNIFVSGTNGTGRTATVQKLLDEFNVGGPVPDDLCYVNNFKDPDQPRLIVRAQGKGAVFTRAGQRSHHFAEERRFRQSSKAKNFRQRRNEIVNRAHGRTKGFVQEFREQGDV